MIVILTYGKVCSTSLKTMLGERFPGEVFYSHGLRAETTALADAFAAEHAIPGGDDAGVDALLSAFADNAAIEHRLEQHEPVTLLVGVRDPIERSLSVTLQMLDLLFPETLEMTPDAAADRLAEQLRWMWSGEGVAASATMALARATIRAPLDWLAAEIEAPFGLNLLDPPFDPAIGYRIVEREGTRVLLYRMENAPQAIEAGLAALFGGEFRLPHANRAKDKAHHAVLEALHARFTLPAPLLDAIYANPYISAFFTAAEIAASKTRWSAERAIEPADVREDPAAESGLDQPAAATPGLRVGTEPVRATVAMAVLNHQKWVAGQLDSLFDQWRPGLDLVVVDDGSSDSSFEAVRAALAARPDIASTLTRNERPRGHGVIPQILSLSDSPVLIQADSDDISLPGRLDAILSRFRDDPRCRLVTTNAYQVSADGVMLALLDTHYADAVFDDPVAAASTPGDLRWVGATAAFHRLLIEGFPLDPATCPYGLDMLLALRATLTGVHHYIAEPLIAWRQHSRNSHRMAGVYSTDDTVQERYRALELMAVAQRIRDVRHVQANAPDSATLNRAAIQAYDLLLARTTEWSRIRNRLTAGDGMLALQPAHSPHPAVAIPPVATLVPGRRRRFGIGDAFGQVVAQWSGIYGPEESWNWTARRALFTVRAGGASGVRLALASPSFIGLQRVRLALIGGDVVEAEIGDEPVEITLAAGPAEVWMATGVGASDHFIVRIDAQAAAAPADHLADHPDTRQLGVRLFWIEAL